MRMHLFSVAKATDLIHSIMAIYDSQDGDIVLSPMHLYQSLTQFISKERNLHKMNINEVEMTVCNDEDGWSDERT